VNANGDARSADWTLNIEDRFDAVGLDDEARSANEAVCAGHVTARLDQVGLSSAPFCSWDSCGDQAPCRRLVGFYGARRNFDSSSRLD